MSSVIDELRVQVNGHAIAQGDVEYEAARAVYNGMIDRRPAAFSPVIACMWTDPADNESNIKWVRDFWTALRPFSEPGGYINFMDADDLGRITDNYSANYARLATVKAKYDPGNLFHINQNIKPAGVPMLSTFHDNAGRA